MKKIISAVFLLFALLASASNSNAQNCPLPKDTFLKDQGVSRIISTTTSRTYTALGTQKYNIKFTFASYFNTRWANSLEVKNLDKNNIPEIGDRVFFLPAPWYITIEKYGFKEGFIQKKNTCKTIPFGEYLPHSEVDYMLTGSR